MFTGPQQSHYQRWQKCNQQILNSWGERERRGGERTEERGKQIKGFQTAQESQDSTQGSGWLFKNQFVEYQTMSSASVQEKRKRSRRREKSVEKQATKQSASPHWQSSHYLCLDSCTHLPRARMASLGRSQLHFLHPNLRLGTCKSKYL